jgi:hypothetical protein
MSHKMACESQSHVTAPPILLLLSFFTSFVDDSTHTAAGLPVLPAHSGGQARAALSLGAGPGPIPVKCD